MRDRITGRTSSRSCVEVRESKFMFVDLASSSKMGMEKPVKKRYVDLFVVLCFVYLLVVVCLCACVREE